MSHSLSQQIPDADEYKRVLIESFMDSYKNKEDIWSDEQAMRAAVPFLLKYLSGHCNILDVGAGRGNDTIMLLKSGHYVTAVDLIAADEWGEIQDTFSHRVRFITGDISSINSSERFDAVLDNGCFHHQHPDHYINYLKHLAHLCVDDAYLVINLFTPSSDINSDNGRLWEKNDGRLTREFLLPEAIEMMNSAGWKVIESAPVKRPSKSHHYLLLIAQRIKD